MANKTYIGDGVYAERKDYGDIVLTTENGVATTNQIVLEPGVWDILVKWTTATERGR